jgi:hypothetical protein
VVPAGGVGLGHKNLESQAQRRFQLRKAWALPRFLSKPRVGFGWCHNIPGADEIARPPRA